MLGEETVADENTQTLASRQEILEKIDQNTQLQIPSSIDDLLLDPGLGKGAEGDEEMTLSEIGTKHLDLSDILEKEGMDLNTIVEKWKDRKSVV